MWIKSMVIVGCGGFVLFGLLSLFFGIVPVLCDYQGLRSDLIDEVGLPMFIAAMCLTFCTEVVLPVGVGVFGLTRVHKSGK